MIYTFSLKEDIQSISIVPEMLEKAHRRFEIYRSCKFFRVLTKSCEWATLPTLVPFESVGEETGFFVFPPLLDFLSICLIEIGKIMLRTAFRSLTSTSPLNKPVSDMLDVFFKYFSYWTISSDHRNPSWIWCGFSEVLLNNRSGSC